MVKPLLLLSAVLVLGASVSASGQVQNPTNGGGVTPHIKEIYKLDCGICHGANGDGKTDLAKDMSLTLSDFTDPKALEGKSDKDLFDLIRNGKDKMPPEDKMRAKDSEVHALIQYIRSLSNGHTSPAQAAPTPTAVPAPAPAEKPAATEPKS